MAKGLEAVGNEPDVGGSSRSSAPTMGGQSGRQADGKFLPGHSIAGGRKPKAVEKAYLDAMQAAMPPEKIEQLLGEALELARSTRSWRGIVEVIQLAMSYGAGKPVSKTVHTDGNLAELLAALQDDKPLLPASVTVQAVAGVSARLDVAADVDVVDVDIKRE